MASTHDHVESTPKGTGSGVRRHRSRRSSRCKSESRDKPSQPRSGRYRVCSSRACQRVTNRASARQTDVQRCEADRRPNLMQGDNGATAAAAARGGGKAEPHERQRRRLRDDGRYPRPWPSSCMPLRGSGCAITLCRTEMRDPGSEVGRANYFVLLAIEYQRANVPTMSACACGWPTRSAAARGHGQVSSRRST